MLFDDIHKPVHPINDISNTFTCVSFPIPCFNLPSSYHNNSITIEILQSNGTTYSLLFEFNCYKNGLFDCHCRKFNSPYESPFYLNHLYANGLVYIYVVYNQQLTSPGSYKIIWKQNSTPFKKEMPTICEVGEIIIRS